MAQDLGNLYTKIAQNNLWYKEDNTIESSFSSLISLTINELCNEWGKRIKKKWFSFKSDGEKYKYLEKFQRHDSGKFVISWSTTFLFAAIDFYSQKLVYINCGDCFGLIFRDEYKMFISTNDDRICIGFNCTIDDHYPISQVVGKDLLKVFSYDQITECILLSDGNLTSNPNKFFESSSNKDFEDIYSFVRRLREKSYDDKTILVVKKYKG